MPIILLTIILLFQGCSRSSKFSWSQKKQIYFEVASRLENSFHGYQGKDNAVRCLLGRNSEDFLCQRIKASVSKKRRNNK